MEARDLLKARLRPFALSLRIRHPSMDPAEISRELRLSAEHSFKAGDPRESASGIAATTVHAESYWLGTLNPTDWTTALSAFDLSLISRPPLTVSKERLQGMSFHSLGVALTVCTSSFLRNHSDFIRRVQTEGGDVSLLVELAAGTPQSFTLSPQIGRALSDLGISVEFEFGNG